MSEQFQFDVFLSHNSKDKRRVEKLAAKLSEAGLIVWLDHWIIKPRDSMPAIINEGLKNSRALMLCISPSALASGWVALEREAAMHRSCEGEPRRFIPILIEKCEIPETLRGYKVLDYSTESETAFASILSACRFDSENALPVPEGDSVAGLETATPNDLAALERMVLGHKNGITCVHFSPTDDLLASASFDCARVWSVKEAKTVMEYSGHSGHITGVCFSPDGKTLFTSSKDTCVFALDPFSGNRKARLVGHRSIVIGVLALTDGVRVLSWSGGGENALKLWNWADEECLFTMSGHDLRIESAVCTRDCSRAIAASADGWLSCWSLETGKLISKWRAHKGDVYSVQVTSDGKFAISSAADRTIKIWNLSKFECVGTLEGHRNEYYLHIALSADDRLIASTGYDDRSIRIWDFHTGACLQKIQHRGTTLPVSAAFNSSGTKLAIGTAGFPPFITYLYRINDAQIRTTAEITRRYVNAKVVLLGEGTVGKTSLAHRLIDDEYVVQDRTHGMNVWRLELPLNVDETVEREALLWDLAGQEDYRLVHQLFLEQTALALLLVNPQKEDPFFEAIDWLKALKTALSSGPTADISKILIFSQVDVGGIKLGSTKIQRFIDDYGIAAWLETSAKTGENCSDRQNGGKPSKLRQLIAQSIAWERLPWTTTPRLLANLKNALIELRDKSDIRLLRFSELAQRLEQALPTERLQESDLRTAVTLLANHGLARVLKFGDLVLLRPDLINGYAGAVIRAARTHTDEIGCVLEARIYHPDFDFTGVDRLRHRADEELLLRALVQTFLDHSLCIAEDTPEGRHLVFPSQYRREKDTPKTPEVFVSYRFSGEWQTIWTTLIVRLWYSQEFNHRELWRNAAEFASSKGHTLGLMINKEGDGAATISLYFDVEVVDELKVIFIEYVHRHLAKCACDVIRSRRYVCPTCRKPVTDLDAVQNRIASKKSFITCQQCDDKVPLVDFIEQRVKSDPIAQKVIAMDATTTRELDTQASEQILIGHMMAITGEANQIFRPNAFFDYGIDGEIEFKDNDGKASGFRIYVQLKSGNSYLRWRQADGREIFTVKDERHLTYWTSQPVDVYLVIRQRSERTKEDTIRWMNVTRYLKGRAGNESRQIVFDGEVVDVGTIWRLRDQYFRI